jgi:hypothetical protein
MKRFNLKFSIVLWILIYVVLLLCALGIGFNVVILITYASQGPKSVAIYSLIIFLVLIIAVVDVSIIFHSCFKIKGDFLYSYLGIVCNKAPISDITEIIHFKKSDKLVVYFSDGSYVIALISPDRYEDFILSLRNVNREITFDTKIDGEQTP